ncbi:MAG: TrmH family RNA methyltransferase [Maricaulaceae bacterium]
MSKETRNSRIKRKITKSRGNAGEAPNRPRKSAGMRAPQAVSAPKSPKKRENRSEAGKNQHNQSTPRPGKGREGGAGWIWGAHACKAVLANPKRTLHTIMMSEAAQTRYDIPDNAPIPKIVPPGMLDKQFGSAHQGIAIKCAPLEWPDLETVTKEGSGADLILVLDQITDPHNVGAMLRLASAFGVAAVVMQDRKAPPLAGALAKVAVGCLETVPVHLVTNIANTLESLKYEGWTITGLAGETEVSLSDALSGAHSTDARHIIVMGAEGPGLRDRVRKTCDQLARIPMHSSDVAGEAESLNVATAAAIALYEARRE